ncbi:MAG: hypothetical protein ABI143_14090 [Caldimonas sp.]
MRPAAVEVAQTDAVGLLGREQQRADAEVVAAHELAPVRHSRDIDDRFERRFS